MVTIAAFLLLASPVQDEPIGELSEAAFLQELTVLGYSIGQSKEPPMLKLRGGSTEVHLAVSLRRNESGFSFVDMATGSLYFDLPRTLGKRQLKDWAENEKLGYITVTSYLGGKVAISGRFGSPKETPMKLKSLIERFLSACRKLTIEINRLGGKVTDETSLIGHAPVELDFKLDWVDAEDLDYMRMRFGWGEWISASGSGWITGAKPLGIPVVFNGMWGAPGLSLTCLQKPDPIKAERFVRNPIPIDWAEATVTNDSVYIQRRLDLKDGITVRKLRDEILDFASRVKALDLY